MNVGTKVLSSIQLVEDVSYRRNIDSIEWNAMKVASKKLVEHETDMRPLESTVEPPPLRKGLLKFLSKEAKGIWAIRIDDVRIKGIPI
ncbi:hypothetical protein J1N35_015447 [Gossypium stocksii]|uniref:Uncharacterized protein n=1 Tax=Gossypium stocksii TaxID=47602 RepID=A0A9D4AAP7_9ROSI|nr:hypothetical protein J1N35_015447 [Gossypium stocksii]